MAAALMLTLAAGLTLPFLIVAGHNGLAPWAARLESLKQAHGAVQLQGWAGLVVAGMGLRLVPRFAGRKPLHPFITVSILVLLLAGLASRTVAQTVAPAGVAALLLVAGAFIAGVGMLLFALASAVTLIRRRVVAGWAMAASAGCMWWIVWALIGVRAATLSSSGLLPNQLEDASNWLALLGAVGNFVWSVQSRSVPIFYGRRPPRAAMFGAALVLYNAGLATLVFALLSAGTASEVSAIGLLGLGLGTVWLAPTAGAVGGRAFRLRPASQSLSRFIIAANLWAVGAGALMVVAGLIGLTFAVRPPVGPLDGAYHAIALGTVTILIVGMGQLITPVFAIQRAGTPANRASARWIMFRALMLAAALRVVAGLAITTLPQIIWTCLIVGSGFFAWLGLATFAVAMSRSWLRQGRVKAELASTAIGKAKDQR